MTGGIDFSDGVGDVGDVGDCAGGVYVGGVTAGCERGDGEGDCGGVSPLDKTVKMPLFACAVPESSPVPFTSFMSDISIMVSLPAFPTMLKLSIITEPDSPDFIASDVAPTMPITYDPPSFFIMGELQFAVRSPFSTCESDITLLSNDILNSIPVTGSSCTFVMMTGTVAYDPSYPHAPPTQNSSADALAYTGTAATIIIITAATTFIRPFCIPHSPSISEPPVLSTRATSTNKLHVEVISEVLFLLSIHFTFFSYIPHYFLSLFT